MSLQETLAKTLGVVPAAPAPPPPKASASKPHWAPPKPEHKYEYVLHVTRKQTGTVRIEAYSADEAVDEFDSGGYEVHWYDDGDELVTYTDCDGVANQSEIDYWEDQYGNRYDLNGEPMCSACGMCTNIKDLTEDPNDSDSWLCPDCLPYND